MAKSRRRTELGQQVSGALPMLWAILNRKCWTDADLTDHLEADSAQVSRILYGDQKPGRKLLGKFLELGIPLSKWDEPCGLRVRTHQDDDLSSAANHAKAG